MAVGTEICSGRTILVVEDDYFLAQLIARAFKSSGAVILGPVANVVDALDLIRKTAVIDGAILDVNLMGEMVYPVADALGDRDVPFVFATGYGAKQLPVRFSQITCVDKAVEVGAIAAALFG